MDNGYEKMNPFKTYSLNKLFYELRRYADLDDPRLRFTSTSQVSEYFGNGMFQFSPNMACPVNNFSKSNMLQLCYDKITILYDSGMKIRTT